MMNNHHTVHNHRTKLSCQVKSIWFFFEKTFNIVLNNKKIMGLYFLRLQFFTLNQVQNLYRTGSLTSRYTYYISILVLCWQQKKIYTFRLAFELLNSALFCNVNMWHKLQLRTLEKIIRKWVSINK